MRINTVQTVLFRILRDVHSQHQQKDSGKSNAGTKPSDQSRLRLYARRITASARRTFKVVNKWLTTFYRLSSRTTLDCCSIENREAQNVRDTRVAPTAFNSKSSINGTTNTHRNPRQKQRIVPQISLAKKLEC